MTNTPHPRRRHLHPHLLLPLCISVHLTAPSSSSDGCLSKGNEITAWKRATQSPRLVPSTLLPTPFSPPYPKGLQCPTNTSISEVALPLPPPFHQHCQHSSSAPHCFSPRPRTAPNWGSQHLSFHNSSHSPLNIRGAKKMLTGRHFGRHCSSSRSP